MASANSEKTITILTCTKCQIRLKIEKDIYPIVSIFIGDLQLKQQMRDMTIIYWYINIRNDDWCPIKPISSDKAGLLLDCKSLIMARVMRIIVCGGRNYNNYERVCEVLNGIDREKSIKTVISGGASGADALAKKWANAHNKEFQEFPANWSIHGKSAGPKRNQEMLDAKPQLVVAFPGGRGTADMVGKALSAGVEIVESIE